MSACRLSVLFVYLLIYLLICLFLSWESVFELGVWSEAVVMTCLLNFLLTQHGMDWRLQNAFPPWSCDADCLLRFYSSHLALHPLPPAFHLTGFISSCGIVLHFKLAFEGSSCASWDFHDFINLSLELAQLYFHRVLLLRAIYKSKFKGVEI